VRFNDTLRRAAQRVMNLKLRASIVLVVIVGLVIPASVTSVLSLETRQRELESRLQSDHERLTGILALGMKEPLWTFNAETAGPLLDSVASDPRIVAATVRDRKLGVFLAREHPERRQGRQFTLQREVVYKDGSVIGDVALEIDSGMFDAIVARERSVLLLTVAGQLLLSVVLIVALLQARLLAPIRRLMQDSGRLARRELAEPFVWRRDNELGSLGNSLEDTRRSLRDLFGELEGKNRELAQSEHKYRGIYEYALEGIYQVSFDGRILSANPAMARILGYDSAQEVVRLLSDVGAQLYVHPQQRLDVLATLREQGVLRGRELEFYRKDGSRIWVSINARVVHDDAGEPQFIEGFVSDITEQKRAEAERHARELAEAANRAKSEFLAHMSHELRTPLNAILGYAQILKREQTLGNPARAGINTIERSGEHLLTLINDVLDLAKIESGKLELYSAPADVAVFLQGIADIIRVRAEAKGLTFIYEASDLPRVATLDERRLRQVLLNLLGNAVKFTDRGQVLLRVRARPNAESHVLLSFEVQDTGLGIQAEDMGRLFQPFQQFGDAQRRRGGTGLGLAISRELVRLMGGDLRATSDPGRGSTFTFALHVSATMAPVSIVAAQRIAVGYEGPRRKLLVVDDVPENRAMLLDMLRPLDFEMFEAENGQQGIERAQALQPDAVLMDNVMPVMDGLETTRRLRSLPDFRDLPIIAISASAAKTDEDNALAAGATAFLPKPVREMDLLALLERHLGVRVIYQEQRGPAEIAMYDPASIVIVPAQVRAALALALTRLDTDAIRAAIAEVEKYDPALRRAFAALADEFQYEQLLSWLLGPKGQAREDLR
jgi:PAS domain S-box-containing protein